MANQTTVTKENEKNTAMKSKSLITATTEELKKDVLISVLAGLIKNYANKKQQN